MHDSAAHLVLKIITDIGDSGLLTVLAFLSAVYLYAVRNLHAALAMSWSLVVCMVVMAVLKIGFRSCHQLVPNMDIVSPSGHAALSAAVLGTIAAIFTCHFDGWRKTVTALLAFILIITISISRVVLGAHTINEVLMGLAIGASIAGVSFWYLHGTPKVVFKARYLAAILLAGMIVFYGAHAPAETFLTKLSELLKSQFHICEVNEP